MNVKPSFYVPTKIVNETVQRFALRDKGTGLLCLSTTRIVYCLTQV